MPTGFEMPPLELTSTKRRIEDRCRKGYDYVPHKDLEKEQEQFYQDYIKTLELEFGGNSKVLRQFKSLYKQCKEQTLPVKEFEKRVELLFKDHDKLVVGFRNTIEPYLHPISTQEENDRANEFLECVKAAFPDNQNMICYIVKLHIVKFRSGKLSLKEITVKMLELLGKRDDLVEAYFKFVPQARNISTTPTFFEYPVIAGVLVVFAVGLLKMKN